MVPLPVFASRSMLTGEPKTCSTRSRRARIAGSVGVRGGRAGAALLRLGAAGLHAALDLAHREAAADGQLRQLRPGRPGGQAQQRLGVAGAEAALLHQGQDLGLEGQDAQQVGHAAALLAQHLGQLLLGRAVGIHQAAVGLGLLDGAQVLALDVLQQRDLQRLGLGVGADQGRHLGQAGQAGGAHPALAGHDAVFDGAQRGGAVGVAIGRLTVVQPPHQHRLQDAHLLDGGRKLFQAVVIKCFTWLAGVEADRLEGQSAHRLGVHRRHGHAAHVRALDQRRQSLAQHAVLAHEVVPPARTWSGALWAMTSAARSR